jgi:hypothetical protein
LFNCNLIFQRNLAQREKNLYSTFWVSLVPLYIVETAAERTNGDAHTRYFSFEFYMAYIRIPRTRGG